MGTDVGYLRFIFYFGLIGLIAFISYIYKSANICIQRFCRWKDLFVLFLLINCNLTVTSRRCLLGVSLKPFQRLVGAAAIGGRASQGAKFLYPS